MCLSARAEHWKTLHLPAKVKFCVSLWLTPFCRLLPQGMFGVNTVCEERLKEGQVKQCCPGNIHGGLGPRKQVPRSTIARPDGLQPERCGLSGYLAHTLPSFYGMTLINLPSFAHYIITLHLACLSKFMQPGSWIIARVVYSRRLFRLLTPAIIPLGGCLHLQQPVSGSGGWGVIVMPLLIGPESDSILEDPEFEDMEAGSWRVLREDLEYKEVSASWPWPHTRAQGCYIPS